MPGIPVCTSTFFIHALYIQHHNVHRQVDSCFLGQKRLGALFLAGKTGSLNPRRLEYRCPPATRSWRAHLASTYAACIIFVVIQLVKKPMASPLGTVKTARGRRPLVKGLNNSATFLQPDKGRGWLPVGGMPTNNDSTLDPSLFEDPPELVCPLTHALFLDPVITTAGHVRLSLFFPRHHTFYACQ